MFLFIFAVIVYFLFCCISSCLLFGDATDCFLYRSRTLLLLLKKPENWSIHHHLSYVATGFVLITTDHCYFLPKKNLPGYLLTFLSFCPCFAFSSFHLVCSCGMLLVILPYAHAQHFCSGCDQKKITPHRNFFRNLNFKNIVNVFKRTYWK